MLVFIKAKVRLFIDMICCRCMDEMHDIHAFQLQKFLKDLFQGWLTEFQ